MAFWSEFFEEAVKLGHKSKEVGLNVATAGGHHRLKKARADYDSQLGGYNISRSNYEKASARFQASREKLDAAASTSVELLKTARDIVERLSWSTTSSSCAEIRKLQPPSLAPVERTLSEINTAVESAKGIGLGAAAGAGAWLLVAHLGTASTGAAIGGLAGAAATNAILAWFGGGALAAGGGGIALGGVVLSGILALPAVAFGAYRSYKEASRIEAETQKVSAATSSNTQNAEKLAILVERVNDLAIWTRERNESFSGQIVAFRDRSVRLSRELAGIANLFAEELSARANQAKTV